jgi:UDP-glucose 4-epimerase
MRSRRVLITGLSSRLGGRLARALEADPEIEAIVGIDTSEPRVQLERTEFVHTDVGQPAVVRILRAAAIDTVIDTRLVADPFEAPARVAQEVNVAGTTRIVEACSGAPVRKLLLKSSAHYYGCERDDPAFFAEEMVRARPPRTAIERSVVEAETIASRFAGTVTILRVAPELGEEVRGSHMALLNLPAVPSILGFDPRLQFIHEEDVVGVLSHAARHTLPGPYNAAADGVLALSEVSSLLGKPMLPVLPPWGTGFAGAQLRRLGLPIPTELLRLLRFGRGLDNRRMKASGYALRYTTREALLRLRAKQGLRSLLESGERPYRYDREVEEFLRWSPSVQSARSASRGTGEPRNDYEKLGARELIEVIPSLEPDALAALRSYEAAHRARGSVLGAVDRALARKRE